MGSRHTTNNNEGEIKGQMDKNEMQCMEMKFFTP